MRALHLVPRLGRILQEQVLAEAAMMVPDTRQRLETALADLHQCLVRQDLCICNSKQLYRCQLQTTMSCQLFICMHMLAATPMYLRHVCCNSSSALHLLVQSQSTKVQESEEYQQAKQTASEAEAVLA